MLDDFVRLKINLVLNPIRTKILLKSPNFTNFWYALNLEKFELVDELKLDLFNKIFRPNVFNFKCLKILIDDFEVPGFETASIFRDNDILKIDIEERLSQKRKNVEHSIESKRPHLDLNLIEEPQIKITKPFEAALIGTSMVKHIDPSKIFENKKCFFKSISGGRILDILEFIKKREGFFNNCSFICITCGSNDCDSYTDIKETIERYISLAQYLHDTYPNAVLLFNELIPRYKTKYVDLDLFENRRVCFNNFMNSILKYTVPCKIIKHDSFEIKSDLETLLSDGVHMTATKGVPLYVQDIKNSLE